MQRKKELDARNVYNLISYDICIYLDSHHHNQYSEYIHYLQKFIFVFEIPPSPSFTLYPTLKSVETTHLLSTTAD